MEYLLLTFDTVLLFLSPLNEIRFDSNFIHGMIIVIILSFFILAIKPLQHLGRQIDTSGKWDSLAIPLVMMCFALSGYNLSQSSDPIKDFSMILIVPVIFIRVLDGIGASHGVMSVLYNFEISELILPSILTFLYFGFVHDFGGFINLNNFQLFLTILHFSMLFLTLVGVKIISKNLTHNTEFSFLYLPVYFTAAAAIFLSCFINFEAIKDLSILGIILYYTFLSSYFFGIILAPQLRKI